MVFQPGNQLSVHHGHARDRGRSSTYNAWTAMMQRCRYPKHKQYADYGGRGINVCDRWLTFENFVADMGERPKGLTLDRWPNNDGDYAPGNCRWATRTEQNRNRRDNRMVTWGGETLCLAEWAERLGITRSSLHERLERHTLAHAMSM